MPKMLDTTLHKAILCYEHGNLSQENINRSRDKSRTFSNNRKLDFKPHPYQKHNNIFLSNQNFNKTGAWINVPTPNTNRPVANRGSKASPLWVSCWKFQGPHYTRNYPNKINGVLHNLEEDPTVEDMASMPMIYASLDD